MKNIFLIIILGVALTGCEKENINQHLSCYDEAIVHDNPCTMDCPGFEGCDGKFYCNACVAGWYGIGPK